MLCGNNANSDDDRTTKASKRKDRRSSNSSSGNRSMHLSAATTKKDLLRELPEDFEPGEYDVVCSRGKWAMNSPGNVRYRSIIKDNLQKYSVTTTKQEKSAIVSEIVESIQALSPLGGFVRSVNGRWYTVTDHIAREKTGQSFRDLLHTQYRSSTKAKRRRQKERDLNEGHVQTKPASTENHLPSQSNANGSHRGAMPINSLSTSSIAHQVFPSAPNQAYNNNNNNNNNMMRPQFPPLHAPMHNFAGRGMSLGQPPQHFLGQQIPGYAHPDMAVPMYNNASLHMHHEHRVGMADLEPLPIQEGSVPPSLSQQQQQQQTLPAMSMPTEQLCRLPPQARLQPPLHQQSQLYPHAPHASQLPHLQHNRSRPHLQSSQSQEHPSPQTLRQQLEPIPLHEAPDTLLDIDNGNGHSTNKSDSFDGMLGSGFGAGIDHNNDSEDHSGNNEDIDDEASG